MSAKPEAIETKLVRATDIGFYAGSLRVPGVEFEVPKGLRSKWFVDVTPELPDFVPDPGTQRSEPIALSQLAEAPRKTFVDHINKKR